MNIQLEYSTTNPNELDLYLCSEAVKFISDIYSLSSKKNATVLIAKLLESFDISHTETFAKEILVQIKYPPFDVTSEAVITINF